LVRGDNSASLPHELCVAIPQAHEWDRHSLKRAGISIVAHLRLSKLEDVSSSLLPNRTSHAFSTRDIRRCVRLSGFVRMAAAAPWPYHRQPSSRSSQLGVSMKHIAAPLFALAALVGSTSVQAAGPNNRNSR